MNLKACHCCGLVQTTPHVQARERTVCCRCQSPIADPVDAELMRTRVAAFALGSLLLFPAATMLPIVQMEKFGHVHRSSLLGGIRELFTSGEWLIGMVVLLFSVVFPVLKLLGLLELTWLCQLKNRHRAITYRIMEHVGKWSMLDVLLLAIMVMWIKLSELVEFQFGPAIFAFAACVAMSMIAALLFDPHAIWDNS